MHFSSLPKLIPIMLALSLCAASTASDGAEVAGSNPILRDTFTADPAPLVVGNRLYLYVGHDEARGTKCSPCANGWFIRPPI